MHKVGICGHFGEGLDLLNGQTIKTESFADELADYVGEENIKKVDTYNWKKKPFLLFSNCVKLAKESENVIILPAHKGVRVFVPIFVFLKMFFDFKLHYIVIGGWFPDLIKTDKLLSSLSKKIDKIYVETETMMIRLEDYNFKNIKVLPNFKKLEVLNKNKLVYSTERPLKLCTFSRVLEEKGIEDAVKAVTEINTEKKETVFTLDIYGSIDTGYEAKFMKIMEHFPDYIKFKGEINPRESIDTLKNYYVLLFPTHYYTEGIPGTILDAFSAGLPVIYSKWENSNDLFDSLETGIGYDFGKYEQFKNTLLEIGIHTDKINEMKENCIIMANEYSPKKIMPEFVKELK